MDTTDILFICGGAFEGIEKIIQNRIGQKVMGFRSEVRSRSDSNVGEILAQILPQDLLKYGMIPEFVGRVPVVVTLDALSEDDLVKILVEPKNALVKQYQKIFALDGVTLEFQEDAIRAVAREAVKRNTGARGLRSVLEDRMLEVMYDLPSRADVTKCVITKEVILSGSPPVLVTAERKQQRKKEETA